MGGDAFTASGLWSSAVVDQVVGMCRVDCHTRTIRDVWYTVYMPGDFVTRIPLTNGLYAVVDAADYPMLAEHKWAAQRSKGSYTLYAMRTLGSRRTRVLIFMHRVIMGLPPGHMPTVDHIDGDGLNNTRVNLRLATTAQNGRNRRLSVNNTSGYKGVSYLPKTNTWQAYIGADRLLRGLGHFSTAEEAARAYDAAARRLHGEFARLNFP